MLVDRQVVRQAVRALGLGQQPLCVHASFRSFGGVTGGPEAVVDGLLDEGCTVLVPTFSWGYAVPPPPGLRPARNGWPLGPTAGIGRVYDPLSRELDPDMGAVAAAILERPEHVRGQHPLCSFSAVGPQAPRLIAPQSAVQVYAPLDMLGQAGGSIVLMGVGLEALTLLHLAEQRAGRQLFWRWANDAAGRARAVAAGGCSDGFGRLAPVLDALTRETRVGRSRWRVLPARPALDVATEEIRKHPTMTHCGAEACARCDDAIQGGPPDLVPPGL